MVTLFFFNILFDECLYSRWVLSLCKAAMHVLGSGHVISCLLFLWWQILYNVESQMHSIELAGVDSLHTELWVRLQPT